MHLFNFFRNRALVDDSYYRLRGVGKADLDAASWRKSSWSSYNGNCFELARLRNNSVGIRDSKDNGSGPVLVFTQDEWSAFLAGATAGEFDLT
jgi:hypothetical protein